VHFDVNLDTMAIAGSITMHVEVRSRESPCVVLHAAPEVNVNPSGIYATHPGPRGFSIQGPRAFW
jgi:hypothetical protein